jgi:hypothetical protein
MVDSDPFTIGRADSQAQADWDKGTSTSKKQCTFLIRLAHFRGSPGPLPGRAWDGPHQSLSAARERDRPTCCGPHWWAAPEELYKDRTPTPFQPDHQPCWAPTPSSFPAYTCTHARTHACKHAHTRSNGQASRRATARPSWTSLFPPLLQSAASRLAADPPGSRSVRAEP